MRRDGRRLGVLSRMRSEVTSRSNLGAVSLGAARLLAVDLGATGAPQFVLLQTQILVARRDPSVAVQRHRFAPLSQIRYAANKCRLFNVKFCASLSPPLSICITASSTGHGPRQLRRWGTWGVPHAPPSLP